MSENNQSESVSNENVKRILNLLKEGDEKINLESYRDVVLVLGNTGSGKSTFTHFVAGKNDELISTKVGQKTGEYIISDLNNKISVNSTVISKTTFPELVIDNETKTPYVDCPGFNDSRNEAYDIAAAYFIKKVMDMAKNVKIVLVISHPSVRKGVNRNDFLQLLEHMTILIKHIEKYADSVALVATKVDNAFDFENDSPVMISDNAIIDNIAQFLYEVKDSLKTMQQDDKIYTSDFKRNKNKVFFENAAKLLDALLQKNGNEYTKLSIFRRPNKPGKLSKIPLLQNGKKSIKEMVKNLKYLPINKRDIGYTVSDKSKNVIRDLVEEISKDISSDLSYIKKDLIDFYQDLETVMYNDDMYTLVEHLKVAHDELSKLTNIAESASIEEMINQMCDCFTLMKVRVSTSRLRDITNLSKFVNFLQDISGKKFETSTRKLAQELDGATKYVDNSLKWYSFLGILHDRLSEYEVQADTSKFQQPKFSPGNLQIASLADFQMFFNQISNVDFLKLINYEDVKTISLDDTKIKYFDKLMQSTLMEPITYTRFSVGDKERVQVVGQYVTLSKVIENVHYKVSKSVQIFAKHTVFIDADLSKDNDISIIAPRMQVIGSHKINLDGSDAEQHIPSKAKNGQCLGCSGANGLPGKPGISGGHFFGVGSAIKNHENLIITANGGRGGSGQYGGDGMRGEDGETFDLRSDDDFYCDKDHECRTVVDYSKSGLFNLNVQGSVTYKVYGNPGQRGGDAGKGGAGGIGGEEGTINLVRLHDTRMYFPVQAEKGWPGFDGRSGDCGTAGRGGSHTGLVYQFGTWSSTSRQSIWGYGSANSGGYGVCFNYACNRDGMQPPLKKDFLHPPSSILSDYKNELVKNLDNCIKKRSSLKFYDEIENNPELQYVYNAETLFREIREIDKHYNEFTVDTATKLYSHMLEKIARSAKKTTNNIERESLQALYVISMGKLMRLKNIPENHLILNRANFFNILSNADTNEIRRYYSNITSQEITDSLLFLESHIKTNIDNTIARLDDLIVKLSLKGHDNELENVLLNRKLFGSLKALTQFLHLAGTLAKADMTVIDEMRLAEVIPQMTAIDQKAVVEVISAIRFESKEISIKDANINALMEDLEEFVTSMERKIDAIAMIVLKERQALLAYGDDYDQTCEQLYDIQKELQSHKHTNAKSFSVDDAIDNAVGRLNNVNEALLDKQNNDELQKIVQQSRYDVKLVLFDTEMYHNIRNEPNSKQLSIAIDHLGDSALILENTINEFFQNTISVLRTIHTSFTNIGYKPNDQAVIRLMVQGVLESMKMTAHLLTQQTDIDENLQILGENLDEVINILANTYESLPIYEERARFNSLQSYTNKDAKNYWKYILGDSMLYEYERFLEVFKRYMFPLETANLISLNAKKIIIDEDPARLKTEIANNVRSLASSLNSIERSNQLFAEDFFNSTSDAGSFFIWNKETYGNAISKLLRGKEIALRATNYGKYSHQMIKFDSIQLKFQSQNDTMQELLNQELKNFTIRMTHSGTSYFAFCNHVNLFNSAPISFDYNFNKSSNTLEPILSPYTTWTFRLFPINSSVSIRSLEPFYQQLIDLHLEGHAKYMNVQNRSVCDEFDKRTGIPDYSNLKMSTIKDNENEEDVTTSINGSENQEYTNFTEDAEDLESTTISDRKRRDVGSSKRDFAELFKGKMSLLKSLNPFNYFIGAGGSSNDDQPIDLNSLEWDGESSSPSPYQPSFNMNGTLALMDYIVRNITKVKPYSSKSSPNLNHVRFNVLDVVNKFEAILLKISHEHHIPSQLEPDPVQLISQLEKEFVNGNESSIKQVLLNSVTVDPEIEAILDRDLTEMLAQIGQVYDDDALLNQKKYDQFYNDHVVQTFNDYANDAVSLDNADYNITLLN